MVWYVEHRSQVRRLGPPKMIPLDKLHNVYGFRSVYAFDEAAVEDIKLTRSTGNLTGHTLYSSELLMDFDNQPEAAQEFAKWLESQGISYEQLWSGNRSVHFHIPFAEPMIGPLVAKLQRNWVKKHAPKADSSFYHPAGMYRLTGTYHTSNPGHCKQLTKSFIGRNKLVIEDVGSISTSKIPLSIVDLDRADLFSSLGYLLTSTVMEGGRDTHLWRILKTCHDLEFDEDKAYQNAVWWVTNHSIPPLDISEVEKKVANLWNQRSNGLKARM